MLGCSRGYTSGGVYNNGVDVHNCAPGNEAGVKCDGMCMDSDSIAIVVCYDLEAQDVS